MKKMKMNIQFFAEDKVLTPSEVLNKIMGVLPIEEWADEMDILQKAISSEPVKVEESETYKNLLDKYNDSETRYTKLTEAYKKRFGELTEEKIQNTLGREGKEDFSVKDLDMIGDFYGGTE